jgi:hypothetical protein
VPDDGNSLFRHANQRNTQARPIAGKSSSNTVRAQPDFNSAEYCAEQKMSTPRNNDARPALPAK